MTPSTARPPQRPARVRPCTGRVRRAPAPWLWCCAAGLLALGGCSGGTGQRPAGAAAPASAPGTATASGAPDASGSARPPGPVAPALTFRRLTGGEWMPWTLRVRGGTVLRSDNAGYELRFGRNVTVRTTGTPDGKLRAGVCTGGISRNGTGDTRYAALLTGARETLALRCADLAGKGSAASRSPRYSATIRLRSARGTAGTTSPAIAVLAWANGTTDYLVAAYDPA